MKRAKSELGSLQVISENGYNKVWQTENYTIFTTKLARPLKYFMSKILEPEDAGRWESKYR